MKFKNVGISVFITQSKVLTWSPACCFFLHPDVVSVTITTMVASNMNSSAVFAFGRKDQTFYS